MTSDGDIRGHNNGLNKFLSFGVWEALAVLSTELRAIPEGRSQQGRDENSFLGDVSRGLEIAPIVLGNSPPAHPSGHNHEN